jgi:glucosamine-6-phosphate deaminase
LKTVRCGDADDLRSLFLDLIGDAVSKAPRIVLAVPTGRTFVDLYDALAAGGSLSLSQAHVFALDELCLDGGGAPFRSFLLKHLVARTDLPGSRLVSLDPAVPDHAESCAGYEHAIEDAGGIDLALLGLGQNGHIAFNEPGSPFSSRTRFVDLCEETRFASAATFDVPADQIRGALTMGIATIMQARRIIAVATGREKADAVRGALTGEVTEDLPASILRVHPDVIWLLDPAAASKLP